MKEYKFLEDIYPYCKKWGVELVEFSSSTLQLDSRFHFLGPGTCDIIADKQVILFRGGYEPDNIIGDILHDLSHIICGEFILSTDEVASSMLALDLVHHRYLDKLGPYELLVRGFMVSDFGKHSWFELTSEEQDILYERSHAVAERDGLLKDWQPTFDRSKVKNLYA